MAGPFGFIGGQQSSGGIAGDISPVSRNEFETLRSQVAQLSSENSTLKTTIQNHATYMKTLESKINTQNAAIVSLNTKISSMATSSTITSIQSQLANFELKSSLNADIGSYIASSLGQDAMKKVFNNEIYNKNTYFTTGVKGLITDAMANPPDSLKTLINQLADSKFSTRMTAAFGTTNPNDWLANKKFTIAQWMSTYWPLGGMQDMLINMANDHDSFKNMISADAITELITPGARDTVLDRANNRLWGDYSKVYNNVNFFGVTLSTTTISGQGLKNYIAAHFEKAASVSSKDEKVAWALQGMRAFVEVMVDALDDTVTSGKAASYSLKNSGTAFKNTKSIEATLASRKSMISGFKQPS
jgi:hypothetical protein